MSINHILDRVFLERSIQIGESGCDPETEIFRRRYDAILRKETETTLTVYDKSENTTDQAAFWRKLSEEKKEKLLHDVYAIDDYTRDIDEEDGVLMCILAGTMGDLQWYLTAAAKKQKKRALRGLPEKGYDFPKFWDELDRRLEITSEKATNEQGLKA